MIKDSAHAASPVDRQSSLAENTAALLFADIADYSSLIKTDERRATLDTKKVFTDIVYPALSIHEGELVQLEGDGFFCKFSGTSPGSVFQPAFAS